MKLIKRPNPCVTPMGWGQLKVGECAYGWHSERIWMRIAVGCQAMHLNVISDDTTSVDPECRIAAVCIGGPAAGDHYPGKADFMECRPFKDGARFLPNVGVTDDTEA